MSEFDHAWAWREKSGFFENTEALRVFHGPGEGKGESSSVSIDRFGSHFWITEWESGSFKAMSTELKKRIVDFLSSKKASSCVALLRPKQSIPAEPVVLMGEPPKERFEVQEGSAKYWIQMTGARHPGLFLDHAPLRRWLSSHSAGKTVLNTFAYTGSLSVAAGLGGAAHVTTLDLSKTTTHWAEANWKLNELTSESRFIAGDVFDWLPRLKREKKVYDCIILDPPSFSRSKQGSFSTAKDLERLHGLAMDLLSDEGLLVTSINSANLSWKKYEEDVARAAHSRSMKFQILRTIDLPETFPTALGDANGRYLKGWVLKRLPSPRKTASST